MKKALRLRYRRHHESEPSQEIVMSQPSIQHNNTNRRNFLTLALVTAAIVPISESALARDRHRHGKVATARSDKQTNAVRDQKTFQTAVALRDLWLGHIFWVRNVSLAAIDKNESSMKAAEQQAV